MGQAVDGKASVARRGALLWAVAACACALAAAGLVYVRRPAPVVETVTTAARLPAPAPSPVYFSPQLPARDADVEQAGDRIAEAEVYVKKRQSAAALNALSHARRAAARALEARQRKGARPDALASALRELDAAQRAIERGAFDDAHRQLIALDKNLDHLDY
jgi:hypothetical protein